MVRKRENIQWAAVVWTKMPCWCQRRICKLVKNYRKATVTQITTRSNQGMQNTISECTTRRTWSRSATAAEDHTGWRSGHLRTGNGGYNLQKAHQDWTIEDWKTLPGLMGLDFCCDIQMVGSEFGVKNMKAWIHPALSQQFRLLVV